MLVNVNVLLQLITRDQCAREPIPELPTDLHQRYHQLAGSHHFNVTNMFVCFLKLAPFSYDAQVWDIACHLHNAMANLNMIHVSQIFKLWLLYVFIITVSLRRNKLSKVYLQWVYANNCFLYILEDRVHVCSIRTNMQLNPTRKKPSPQLYPIVWKL